MVRRAFSGCSLLLFYLITLLIFFRPRFCPIFYIKKSTRFSDALLFKFYDCIYSLRHLIPILTTLTSCLITTPQPHHTDTQTPLPLPHLHESVRNSVLSATRCRYWRSSTSSSDSSPYPIAAATSLGAVWVSM